MKKLVIDPLHSDINFKVKHLMISSVNGNFSKFDATMEYEKDDFTDAKINFETDVDTISTNIKERDNHLKSQDFFDVENFPKITFESSSIKKGKDGYTVKGLMRIKGVAREISLHGTYNGNDVDAYGQTKYGFELDGVIKRSDFGLNFNLAGAKGSMLIGDDVKIIVSVQMMEPQLVSA